MTNGRHVYKCITDFKAIRWQRLRVLIGDAPDIRDCTFLILASIYRDYVVFDHVVFHQDLPIYHISAGTMAGQKRYLFKYDGLEDFYEKKCLEFEVKEKALALPVEQQLILASWVVELAGASSTDLAWFRPANAIERFLPNVGVPDLRTLLGTLPQASPAA